MSLDKYLDDYMDKTIDDLISFADKFIDKLIEIRYNEKIVDYISKIYDLYCKRYSKDEALELTKLTLQYGEMKINYK